MPRTVWSGAISFGLVTVPVHVQSATEHHAVQFHQYHLEDMGRVRVRMFCELEHREVANAEIGKGYEYARDQVVAVSDEELRNLPLPTAKAIEIAAFVPLESVDPIRIGDGYYLAPDGKVAEKPYKLLVQALGRSSKVAVAKYAWSGRERLGLVRVRDDVLVLHAMRWPDEIRDPSIVDPPTADVDEEEIDGALALMETMAVDDLEGDLFSDTYTEALAKVIEAKREHQPLPDVPEPEQPGKVLDLMAALQESVSKARASRGGGRGRARDAEEEGRSPEGDEEGAGEEGSQEDGPEAAVRLVQDAERRVGPTVAAGGDAFGEGSDGCAAVDGADAFAGHDAVADVYAEGRPVAVETEFQHPVGWGRPCFLAAALLQLAAFSGGDGGADFGELQVEPGLQGAEARQIRRQVVHVLSLRRLAP